MRIPLRYGASRSASIKRPNAATRTIAPNVIVDACYYPAACEAAQSAAPAAGFARRGRWGMEGNNARQLESTTGSRLGRRLRVAVLLAGVLAAAAWGVAPRGVAAASGNAISAQTKVHFFPSTTYAKAHPYACSNGTGWDTGIHH